jgi:peptide/nickel transport system substrate-binding protein
VQTSESKPSATLTRRATLTGLAGAAVARRAAAQTAGGDFVLAQPQPPPSMDAMMTSTQPARNITMHVYETLVARSEKGTAIPDLAQGVEVSTDSRRFIFTLRRGVKFHNGKEMTSADVVASTKRYRDIGESYGTLDLVERIEATGPYEVEMRMSAPYPIFAEVLSTVRVPAVIIPEEEAVKQRGQARQIGTGPYKVVEYSPDSHVHLARFDGYIPNPNYADRDGFGGRKTPYLDTITIRFVPEDGARTSGLLTGEYQFNETLVTASAERLKRNPAIRLVENSPWAFQLLRFNMSDPVLANLDFRRAVQAGLDHEEIMAIASEGLFDLDASWVYPSSPYHSDAGKEYFNRNDSKLAKELLKKSGYAGQPLTFMVDPLKNNNQSAVVAQQQMRALGINVELRVLDFPTVSAMAGRADAPWHFWSHVLGIEPYEGPHTVTTTFVGERSRHRTGNDPEINRAYQTVISSPDFNVRKAAFEGFQRRLGDQALAIKLGNFGILQGMRSNVEGFEPSRIPRLWNVRLQ